MKFKSLYFVLFGMALAADAWAISIVSDTLKTAWGVSEFAKNNTFGDMGTYGDFILHGDIGKGGGRGTRSKQYAIVAVIAKQIVEHGGYFCPQQIQCGTELLSEKSWTWYYNPAGFDESMCAWFCEPGYTGNGCADQTSLIGAMDKQTNKSDLYAGLSLNTNKKAGLTEASVSGFAEWGNTQNYKDGRDILLGVVDFREHAVVVGPVSVSCHAESWGTKVAYVNKVSQYNDPALYKTLCAEGYILNSMGTDCVKMTEEMLNLQKEMNGTSGQPKKQMCSGWTDSGYDSAIHNIDSTGECVKYVCKDKTKAFPAPGNYECTECAGSVRGGQNPLTGLCVICEQVGQYYDVKTRSCKDALAFSKIDMQYGKGKTKDSYNRTDDQCWTKVSPDEYKDCVFGKAAPVLSSIKLGGVIPLNIGLANAYTVNTSINSTNSNSTGTTSTNNNSTNNNSTGTTSTNSNSTGTTSTNSNNNYTGGALGGGSSAPAVPQHNSGSYTNNAYANQTLIGF